jgi:hypothetical protein
MIFQSLLPTRGRGISGQVPKALIPTSGNCILVCVCCQVNLSAKSQDFQIIFPTRRQPVKHGLKALWPNCRSCILECVSYHTDLKALNPDPLNHNTSTNSSSPHGSELIDRNCKHWKKQTQWLDLSVLHSQCITQCSICSPILWFIWGSPQGLDTCCHLGHKLRGLWGKCKLGAQPRGCKSLFSQKCYQ